MKLLSPFLCRMLRHQKKGPIEVFIELRKMALSLFGPQQQIFDIPLTEIPNLLEPTSSEEGLSGRETAGKRVLFAHLLSYQRFLFNGSLVR